MKGKWFFIIPAAIVGVALFTFIGGTLVMQLWNWLLPPLFGWKVLTFWQALAMLVLSRILFGGLGMHGSGRPGMRNPEVRERFRQRMRERFGFETPGGESKPLV